MELDPRFSAIERRLSKVNNIVAVVSSKGGVGKTLVSTLLAVELARRGLKVGLLDLDVTNPTAHIVLGTSIETLPEEEKGVVPPIVAGVKFMSVAYYAGENPLPLRGHEISSAIREVLTITRWENLDYLLIDMPPGMSDEFLEVLTYIKTTQLLLITTPSILSIVSLKRLAKLVQRKIVGIIENMTEKPSQEVLELAEEMGTKYLGNIPYTPEIENHIGNPHKILQTPFGKALTKIADNFLTQTKFSST